MDVSNKEIIDSVTGKTDTVPLEMQMQDEDPLAIKIANVMQINTVVKTIFKFLSLKDIKSCRQVCLNWDELAEPLLRKRCKIVFDFSKGRTHAEFAKTFSFAHSTLDFTAFKFCKGDWPKSVVEDFFKQQQDKKTATELEFDTMILKDENNKKVPNPCVDDWLMGLPIKKLSIVTCDDDWSVESNLMVSLDVLNCIEELHLDRCKIHSGPMFKIAPKKIKLFNVMFCRNKYTGLIPSRIFHNDVLNEIQINTITDFKNAIEIQIECPTNNSAAWATYIIARLTGCVEIDNLKMVGGKITDWGGCTIKHLQLNEIPLVEPNSMKVKSLSFSEASLDLSVLSPEIEDMWIGHWRNATTNVSCSEPVNFPKLKRAIFYLSTINALPYFKNCPNLVDVHITGQENTLNVDLLPKSVKRLQMSAMETIIGDKENKMDIDHLIFYSVSLEDVEKALEYFNPQNIVVEWRIDADNDSNDKILNFLDKYKYLKSICIGPFFIWGETNMFLRESRLSEIVEGIANFYVFENSQGRGISFQEYDKFKVL